MNELRWWQRGLVYQVYPRSFQDTTGDGVGDVAGVIRRLDYLADLGVDAVWLSPIYPSPMADFGYDVSDYCDVDPLFGSLADVDRLIAALHARGMKLILDYVPNHTSNRHPWFLASRSSRTDAKRDWYLWRDAKPDGSPPNNWISHFGGSAWEWDAPSGQYYLHSFLKEQPDLNWRDPAEREAMYGVLRFWLDRGVDGFRVDVLWLLIKDELFRDNPPNPAYVPGQGERESLLALYDADRPETLEIVREMRRLLDSYGDRVLIGEIYLPVRRLVAYYGSDLLGAQLPFNFQLMSARWDAASLAEMIRRYEAALPAGAWPNWVLSNHDKSRIATRIGPERARLATLLLLTLRGTPTMYYGDELGMTDVAIPPDRVRDPAERRQPGIGMGRDPERTPMPWDGTPGRGFTTGEPWLPFGDAATNVAAEDADAASMLSFVRRAIALRRARAELSEGAIGGVEARGDVLTYRRVLGDDAVTVALNFGGASAEVPAAGELLLSTDPARPLAGAAEPPDLARRGGSISIGAYEGVVFRTVSG